MMLSFGASQTFRRVALFGFLVFTFLFQQLPKAAGALQFDVFAGYDSYVREGDWFPITFEVNNDGPSFRAFIEISSPSQFNRSQARRVQVDLPTGTLKRISIPVFAASRHGMMEARLVDAKGRIIVKQELDWQKLRYRSGRTVILGALGRTAAGLPTFPNIKVSNPELQPAVARWQPDIFPDNPISLQGMQSLYLSSERALDLKDAQIKALLAWLQSGGHLIVGVEQIGDVNGTAWLREIIPAKLSETKQVAAKGAFLDWLREKSTAVEEDDGTATAGKSAIKKKKTDESVAPGALYKAAGTNLQADATFERSELQVVVGQLRNGRVIASSEGIPLAIQSVYGRGEITLLTFSPERQPFAGWANKDWLWALIAQVPAKLYESGDYNDWGLSADSVIGSMIESTQVRKVPLMGLVGLLIIYLVIIGPVDQLVLRRMNKQMLTWITFPCYVLLFSGLIYFIGFKLRAGDSEYTELHIVDVLPNQEKAILRGKTYASIYSPANSRYELKSEQFIASLRGEYLANYGNSEENSQAQVNHVGNRFDAEIYVPVWTSQLYVNDWWEPLSANPLVLIDKGPLQFSIANNLDRVLKEVRICVNGSIYDLGEIPANSSKEFNLEGKSGTAFREFAGKESAHFVRAAEMRRQTFGSESSRIKWDLPRSTSAACFISQMNEDEAYRHFTSYAGLDLSKFATQDSVILLAWDAGNSLTAPLNRFKAARGAQNTLLRVVAHRQQPQLSPAN